MIFCTLFDSNYLDKGLALYYSMMRHMKEFKLYVYAFDSRCYEVMTDMSLENVVVISLDEIMTEELQRLQKERTRAEFCWTCTPVVIEHVLVKYNETICTYIDADIYFFSSPERAIQEIIDAGCSVGIVEHGFERNYEYGKNIFECGKYCVQFNTFIKNEIGLHVLEEWKRDCLKWCFNRPEDGKLGDQRYLDTWEQKYSGIYVSKNRGMGLAPWNLHIYTEVEEREKKIFVKYQKECFAVVFFHFEGIKYLKEKLVFLNIWNPSARQIKKKIKLFYGKYFREIKQIRLFLEQNYHITFTHMIVKKSVVLNENFALKSVGQKYGCIEGLKKWWGNWRNNLIWLDY